MAQDPADPVKSKQILGCWVGFRTKADYKRGGTLHASEWVGGSGCLAAPLT